MKNRKLIEDKLKTITYCNAKIGTYDSLMEKVNEKDMEDILAFVEEGWIDIPVTIDNKKYVVEIETVENEVDFHVINVEDYEKKYGRKFEK